MKLLRITPQGTESTSQTLDEIIQSLRQKQAHPPRFSIHQLLDLLDDFSARLLSDERTRQMEGIAFLSAWLKRKNLCKLLELNLNGRPDYLDGFLPYGKGYLTAKPHGLVAMWLAGNVATLPMFSLVPALLTKNVCLVKLSHEGSGGMDRLLATLADSKADGLEGLELLESVAVVYFDHRERRHNEAMSLAADAKVIWGGKDAVRGISSLPRQEHCVEIIFGPKYSIGFIDGKLQEQDPKGLENAIASFVRDIATWDQRGCSSPQTIFVERNSKLSLRDVGELFEKYFVKLPPKSGLDAYTTMQILNSRAEWAIHPSRDVIASKDGANWTVCMDGEVYMKEAVQSRTIFLTQVDSWRDVIPLLSHKVQTVGIALADRQEAMAFAEAASSAGAVRCVRPGLMNLYESPWDGKLFVNQLVRWITLKL